jgi:hypothetical protein
VGWESQLTSQYRNLASSFEETPCAPSSWLESCGDGDDEDSRVESGVGDAFGEGCTPNAVLTCRAASASAAGVAVEATCDKGKVPTLSLERCDERIL